MQTIKQKTVLVQIEGGQSIEVRRMRWKSMREFLKKLAGAVSKIYGMVPAGDAPTILALLAGRLPEILAASDELSTLLVTGSTDLTAEALDNLDTVAAAAVIQAAIDLNLDEETKNSWAGIGRSVRALMPAETVPASPGKAT